VTAERITVCEREVLVECVDLSGATEIIHADYMVRAGRAHNPVRYSLHKDLVGIICPRYDLVADVAVNGVHRVGALGWPRFLDQQELKISYGMQG